MNMRDLYGLTPVGVFSIPLEKVNSCKDSRLTVELHKEVAV